MGRISMNEEKKPEPFTAWIAWHADTRAPAHFRFSTLAHTEEIAWKRLARKKKGSPHVAVAERIQRKKEVGWRVVEVQVEVRAK